MLPTHPTAHPHSYIHIILESIKKKTQPATPNQYAALFMPKPDCQLLNVNVHGIKNDVRKIHYEKDFPMSLMLVALP